MNPWLIWHRYDPDASIRLFCLHCAGGSASEFRKWSNHLPIDVELVAIQMPGREGRIKEPFITSMEELTSGIVDAMTPFLDKPYLIFGHSFGAIAGFEVIRKMRRVGLKQPFLFLAAGRRGAQVKKKKPPISSLPTEAFARELLKEYGDHIRPILESRTLREAFIPQILADFVLSENYHFCEEPPLDCPIVAYAGSLENDLGMDELMAWSAHTSQSFHSRRFPGDHFFIRESRELVIKAIGQRIAAIRFGETTRSYLRT